MNVQDNLNKVRQEMDAVASRSGRKTEEIHLIAVSKTRPVDEIRSALDSGQFDFGENKPQEIRDKYPQLPDTVRWHMIGHLQSNKIKYVVGKCALIHSVDTQKLARELQTYAKKTDTHVDILLQIDIAKDGKKQGFDENEILDAIEEISGFSHIHVKGLMTIAPFYDDPEDSRKIFRRIKQISVDIQGKNYDNVSMNVLSMGMSNDFAVAIEEGATHLRIGTAIFGERN